MTDVDERLRDASRNCTSMVVWHPRSEPAEVFAALAKACEELGVEEWDTYGEGGAVDLVERQVAELLGKPAAVSSTCASWAARRRRGAPPRRAPAAP